MSKHTDGGFAARSFPRGVDLLSPETAIPDGGARAAINVDFDRMGKWRRRTGTELVLPMDDAHSLWAPKSGAYAYFVAGTALCRLDPIRRTRVILRTGLAPGAPMSFCEVNEDIFYSNGYQSGSVFGTIGVEMPIGEITCAATTTGALPPGAYKVGMVYVKTSGEESGPVVSDFVLAVAGGISVEGFSLPQDPAIQRARFYLSPPDGEALYQVLDTAFTNPDITFTAVADGKMLETQFMQPPPPAHLLQTFNGRLYGADGSILWYTQAFRYGLHNPASDYVDMGARITLIEEAADKKGLFVGTTEGTFFLAGDDMAKMELQSVSELAPIEGTGTAIDTKVFGMKELPEFFAPVWFTQKGWVVGLNDGTIKNLIHDRLVVSNLERGAAIVRKQNGNTHLMGVFRGSDGQITAASDSMTSEVIRNGIVI